MERSPTREANRLGGKGVREEWVLHFSDKREEKRMITGTYSTRSGEQRLRRRRRGGRLLVFIDGRRRPGCVSPAYVQRV